MRVSGGWIGAVAVVSGCLAMYDLTKLLGQ